MGEKSYDLTTRRSYIAGLAGTTLSLAGLWEVLDVGGGHGHSHGGSQPLDPSLFEYRAEEYAERYAGDDGVVEPPQPPNVPEDMKVVDHHGDSDDTAPIYLRARQFQFTPTELRLETGVPYTFYMMSTDVPHGVSLNTPTGSIVHRLQPNVLAQDTLTFSEPGEYLLYCGFYCGPGHDAMSGTITVTEGDQ